MKKCGADHHVLLNHLFEVLGRTLKAIIEKRCVKLSCVSQLSLYLMSKDNMTKRADGTVGLISSALKMLSDHIAVNKVLYSCVKMRFVGDLEELPIEMKDLCDDIERCTSEGSFLVFIAINYDPFTDCVKLVEKDESRPAQGAIDLVIRSGGEKRSSGFFPLQCIYSEWVYLDSLFPDLTWEDVEAAVEDYEKRNRRFGS
jgi:undecaprenyl pyrophosphate synthase